VEHDELLPGRLRFVAVVAAAGAAAAAAALALYTAGRRRTGLDDMVDEQLRASAQRWGGGLDAVVNAARPLVVLLVCLSAATFLGLRGARRAALLCGGAPVLGMGVTIILQNLVDRPSATVVGSHDAFPSGHMVGPAAVVVVLLLLWIGDGGRALGRQTAAALTGGTAVGAALLALALTAMRHHYVTDVLGAVAVAVATVATCALLLDARA
jgi:membrane-associated phospholipid phosphatase